MKRMTEAMQDIATAIRETKPKQKEKGMKSEVLPPETLTPSCRNAAELAREIGRLVSREIGIETSILFMQLDMSDMEGNDVTISWKLGERT